MFSDRLDLYGRVNSFKHSHANLLSCSRLLIASDVRQWPWPCLFKESLRTIFVSLVSVLALKVKSLALQQVLVIVLECSFFVCKLTFVCSHFTASEITFRKLPQYLV